MSAGAGTRPARGGLGYALVPQGWMVFPLIAVGSLQWIAAIAGPPLMTGIFSLATRPGSGVFWPRAPYAAAVALLAVLWREGERRR